MSRLIRLLTFCALFVSISAAPAFAGTFVVTSNADTGPGTLRDGIAASADGRCTTPCTITFQSPMTINSLGDLSITTPDVTIDGFSAPGARPNSAPFPSPDDAVRNVIVNGPSNTCGCTGINSTGTGHNATIRGLVVRNFGTALLLAGNNNRVIGSDITNNVVGIRLTNSTASGTSIGSEVPGDRNIIRNSIGSGIDIQGPYSNPFVDGNFIGTDPTGTVAAPNNPGITVNSGVFNAIIGARGNLIAGNTNSGIVFNADSGRILNNIVGTSGLAGIGNSGMGIRIAGNNNYLDGNIISSNSGDGVEVAGGRGNDLRANIYNGNGGIGIDLASFTLFDGPTANDVGDADVGGNGIQNFPVIHEAQSDGAGNVYVRVSIDSSLSGNAGLSLELYRASTDGEGLEFLSSGCYGSQLSFAVQRVFFGNLGINVGDSIVMTATTWGDTSCSAPGDGTSEFSAPAAATLLPGTVVNTNDSGPGSLRQAIIDANSGACDDGFGGCYITFAIPPAFMGADGTFSIQPLTPLPPIVRAYTQIRGYTQRYFGGDTNPNGPEIVLNGAAAGAGATGIEVAAVQPPAQLRAAGFAGAQNVDIYDLVINGFNGNGVWFHGDPFASTFSNEVHSCYIGTDADGTTAVPNTVGVRTGPFAYNTVVSGPSVDAVAPPTGRQIPTGGGFSLSIVSGNGVGILADSSDDLAVYSTEIGVGRGGVPVPNGTGISLEGTSSAAQIGYGGFFSTNTIAYNTGAGIFVDTLATRNTFNGNSIHDNGGLGIDLAPLGPTPNDPQDVDTGANNLRNFPVITSRVYDPMADTTTVSGTYNGEPNDFIEIQIYDNIAPDPSGYGEGRFFIGYEDVNTDGNGDATFSIVVTGNYRYVTPLAVMLTKGPGETSEFGRVSNAPPVANPDTATTPSGTPVIIPVLSNDTDADSGDTITITGSTNGANGTVVCTTACTYTPNAGFAGTDTFTYTISDGIDTATGTVTVTVVNQPPVAVNDAATTPSATPVTINVVANDRDPENQLLTITAFTQGASGTVSCATPNCTYTPAAGFNGTDTFTYTITDVGGLSGTASVTVGVNNQPPVAANDSGNTPSGTPVTINVVANDVDPEFAPLTITTFTQGTNGTVTCSTPNCTYTPATGFVGTDTFQYTVSDQGGLTSTATVTINVGNRAPVAANDTGATTAGTPVTVNVLANDADPEGQPMTITLTAPPANGTATCVTPNCTYTPAPGFTGTDVFLYTVTDSFGASATATVTITVTLGNRPPVVNPDTLTATPGQPASVNVLANDSDPDGDPLSLSSFTQGAQGSVSCSPSGLCTYTAFPSATGTDSFSYTVTDGRGGVFNGVVTVGFSRVCPTFADAISPSAGSTVPTDGLFEFAGDGDAFEVFYGRAGSGCSTSQATTTSRSVRYFGLEPNTVYEWRVESKRSGCPSVSSTCVTFRTARGCEWPVGLTPAPGTRTNSPVNFSWTAVEGATQYRLFTRSGTTETLIGTTTGTSLTASVPAGAQLWYVVAEGIPQCGNLTSVPIPFEVCGVPGAPLASIVGEATTGQTYRLSWPAVGGATRYEVIESTSPQFTNPTTYTTTATFLDFTKNADQAPIPYHYIVRAFSDCFGQFGDTSRPVRVVVVPIPPLETPNTFANTPLGSTRPVVLQVFVPGIPGQTLQYTARGDQPWMQVRPDRGQLPPAGVTLDVTVDPRNLPNGTFTGTVIVEIVDTASGRLVTHATATVQVPVSINLVTPVTPLDPGTPTADSIIIPIVGHLDGIDARWRSDVRIANISSATARYIVAFTPQDQSLGTRQTTIEVTPGTTTALDDIVRAWYGIGSPLGESSAGTVEVRRVGGSPGSVSELQGLPSVALTTVVSSRTYAQTQQGTLGEFVPGILYERFIGLAAQNDTPRVLNLQQIAQNDLYRTNVGLLEASGQSVSAIVSIFNSAGTKLDEIRVDLAGNQQLQLNGLLAQRGITLPDGRIEVRVTGGQGRMTAYAAVVDNRTKDQLLIPAAPLGEIVSSRYVMPGIAHLNTGATLWRSDMRLFNSGSTEQTATLTLHPQNNSGAPRTATVSVAPGEVEVLDNVVQSVFGATGLGGAVHVDTVAPSQLVVTGRTYNQTPTGTLGLFIPAVTPQQAIGTGERSLNIVQAEESVRFRTNVGIAEVTGNAATVEMQVHIPGSLATPRFQFELAPNEFRQIPILQALGSGAIYNARITTRVTSGAGRVTAYGSVIDMKTNDSTYVPAQ